MSYNNQKILILFMLLSVVSKGFAQLVYVQDLYLESVKNNNIEQAKQYLDAGMDVSVLSRNYPVENALMIAVQNDNMKMIQFLLDRGADPSITLQSATIGSDIGYPSALKYAVEDENYVLVKFLAEELIKRSKIGSIEEGYKFAEKMEDDKAMDILEQTGYIITEGETTEELTEQKLSIFNAKYSDLKQRDIDKKFPNIEELIITDKAFIKYLKEIRNINISYEYIMDGFEYVYTDPYYNVEDNIIVDHFSYAVELYGIDVRDEFINSEDTPRLLKKMFSFFGNGINKKFLLAVNFLFDHGVLPSDIDPQYFEKKMGGMWDLEVFTTDLTKYVEEKQKEEILAKEKVEEERIAKEKAEEKRIAKEKVEEERIAKEKAEEERIAKEKVEEERIAKEKAEEKRLAKEKVEKEKEEKRLAKEKKAEEKRIAKEKK